MEIDETELAELSRAFDELGAAMRRGRARSAATSRSGLSAAQFEIVRALHDRGGRDGLRISQLATAAGVAAPTATRMLRALTERGLIERHPDSEDERVVRVTLTAQGEERLRTHRASLQRRQRAAFGRFTPEERGILLSALRRLVKLVDESD